MFKVIVSECLPWFEQSGFPKNQNCESRLAAWRSVFTAILVVPNGHHNGFQRRDGPAAVAAKPMRLAVLAGSGQDPTRMSFIDPILWRRLGPTLIMGEVGKNGFRMQVGGPTPTI